MIVNNMDVVEDLVRDRKSFRVRAPEIHAREFSRLLPIFTEKTDACEALVKSRLYLYRLEKDWYRQRCVLGNKLALLIKNTEILMELDFSGHLETKTECRLFTSMRSRVKSLVEHGQMRFFSDKSDVYD